MEDDFDDHAHVVTLVLARGGMAELSCGWTHVDENRNVECLSTKLAGCSTLPTCREMKEMVGYTPNAIE